MQGTRGAIRTGGDGAGGDARRHAADAAAARALFRHRHREAGRHRRSAVRHSGLRRHRARHGGRLVARTKSARPSGDVIVRDPVVLTATLPRFLLTGDRGTMRLDLDNVEGPAGDYAISVQTDGPLAGRAGAARRSASPASSAPASACRSTRPRSASATSRCGSPGRTASTCERSYTLAAKPATQILTRRTVRPIAKGESITLSSDLFADLVPGTGGVQLSVGPSTALDVAALLKALDRYPFGCSEQIDEPRAAAALRQRAGERGAALARRRDRPAHPRRDRAAAGAAGLERLVRPVGRRAATTSGSTPT